MRAGDLDHLCAQLDQCLDGLANRGGHPWLGTLTGGELGHQAQPDPGQVTGRATPRGFDNGWYRRRDRRGIAGIVPGDHLVQQRRIEDVPGHRTRSVQ
jgi:hypothetical protein